jgi:hypothetical protein
MGHPDGAEADPSSEGHSPTHRRKDEPARTRAADRWIADRLRQIRYDLGHPEAQQLADHLQNLGIGTLINLKNEGKLFSRSLSLAPGGLPETPEAWDRESTRVIVVAVRMAIPNFITKSMPDWDPSQSAIDTYFVNYCLLKFRTAFAQFCREESRASFETPSSNIIEFESRRSAADNVEDIVIARETLREMVAEVGSTQFAEYVKLALEGKTQAQSAAALGISQSALNRRVREWRETLGGSGRVMARERKGEKL